MSFVAPKLVPTSNVVSIRKLDLGRREQKNEAKSMADKGANRCLPSPVLFNVIKRKGS